MSVCLPALDAYRLWSGTWDQDPSPIVALEAATIAPWLQDARGCVVVDAGCGTGRWMTHLHSLGAYVLGFDFSLPMLERAAAKPGLGGRLVAADLRRLPLRDGAADVLLCALALGHAPSPMDAMRELCRVVAGGGTLIVTDFHPEAARRGWKRTFQHQGATFEVENHAYTAADLMECARECGLALDHLAEPHFDERHRLIFERAGRPDLFATAIGAPAILAARWSRP